jgi:hypothetical protein
VSADFACRIDAVIDRYGDNDLVYRFKATFINVELRDIPHPQAPFIFMPGYSELEARNWDASKSISSVVGREGQVH